MNEYSKEFLEAKEKESLEALQAAERNADALEIEKAVNGLALFYAVAAKQFVKAVPFWRRGAELLAVTLPDSCELATYLHNMAVLCLLPAGLQDEAQAVLKRARQMYLLHYLPEAPWVKDVETLIR